jgi:hypothetical protein
MKSAPAQSMPDPGVPPEAVIRQREEIQRLLDSGESVASDLPNQSTTIPTSGSEPVVIPPPTIYTPAPVRAIKAEKVDLEYVSDDPKFPGFTLTFSVAEVCLRQYYISLMLVGDMGFRPTGMSKFNLKYRGKNYPVIFVGSEFEFQSVGIRGISFLLDKDRMKETNP